MSSSREVTIRYLADGSQAKAETRAVSQEVDNIGKAARSSANITAASTDNIARSTRTAAQSLAAYDQEILQARADLAALNQRIIESSQSTGANSVATRELKSEYQQQAAVLRALTAEKALLAVEAKEEAASERAAAQAAREQAAAQQQASAAYIESSAAQLAMLDGTNKTAEGFNRLTTRISVGRGVLSGYDAAIEGVVRAFGGIQLWIAVAIGLFSTLLPKLLSVSDAKKEIITVSREEISTNLLVAQSYERVASSATISAQGFQSFEQNARQVSEAGIATNLLAIADAQTKLEKESRNVDIAFKSIAEDQQVLASGFVHSKEVQSEYSADINHFKSVLQESSKEIDTQQKALAEQVSTMRLLRDVFGFTTDNLIEFARRAGASPKELDAMRRALNSDIDTLRQFSEDLSKAEGRIFNVENAALRLAVALQQIKPPNISMDFLRGLNEDPNQRIERAMATAMGGFKAGPPDTRQIFGAIQPELREMRDQFRQNAAAMASSKEEARRLYDEQVNRLNPAYREQMLLLDKTTENLKAFTEQHKSGGAAARAHALEENKLATALAEAQAALEIDTFSRREAKIEAETAGLRKALAIRFKDKANFEDQLAELEKLKMARVARDRYEAEQKINEEIEAMRIKGIQDEYTRRQAEIRQELNERTDALFNQFGDAKYVAELIDKMKRAKEAEFFRWLVETSKKANEQIMQDAERFAKQQGQDLLNEANKVLDLQTKDFQRHLKEIDALIQTFGQRRGSGLSLTLDIVQLERVNAKLKETGLTVRAVDSIFGGASKSIEQFEQRLDTLTQKNITTFGQLRAITRQFWDDLVTTGQIWQILGNTIAGVFQSAISGQESWKDALIKAFLTAIAQIAMMLGNLFILAAAGLAFIPGLNWSAGPLIAAGIALMAFAGVLQGVAGLIGGNRNSAGTTGGAGGASSTSASSTSATPIRAFVVPSGSRGVNQPQQIVIQLSDKGTSDFLRGKKVLTMDNAGREFRAPMTKLVKNLANA